MLPNIGVPPNHPFWGIPIFGNTHILIWSSCFKMASVDLNWGHITLMNDAKKSGCGVNPYSIFRWDVHGSDRNWLGSWWISPIYGNFMGGKQSTESTSIGVYHNPWILSSSRTSQWVRPKGLHVFSESSWKPLWLSFSRSFLCTSNHQRLCTCRCA